MLQPIRQRADGPPCQARQDARPWRTEYLRALLRLFAELACRLR
ncbi:hypothetical protein [Pseudoduganella albidiflava]|nr:hypothetical protein [Pseudoduganella albidiflava]